MSIMIFYNDKNQIEELKKEIKKQKELNKKISYYSAKSKVGREWVINSTPAFVFRTGEKTHYMIQGKMLPLKEVISIAKEFSV